MDGDDIYCIYPRLQNEINVPDDNRLIEIVNCIPTRHGVPLLKKVSKKSGHSHLQLQKR